MTPGRYPPLVILVRHGQTDFNAERRFQGQMHIPLNNNGRDQTRRAGEIVANILQPLLANGSIIESYLASHLRRAWQSAEEVQSVLQSRLPDWNRDFTAEPTLQEIDVGRFQGYTFDEFRVAFPEDALKYLNDYERNPSETPSPGGESRADVAHRLNPLLQQLTSHAQHTHDQWLIPSEFPKRPAHIHLWITHGGVITILLEKLGAVPANTYQVLGNGDVIVIIPHQRSETGIVWKKFRHYEVGDSVAAGVFGNRATQ